jgi:muramoyltetrapeptide carboxypeptidase
MPNSLTKPPALRAGDVIGIVAPASNVKKADLDAGCEALRKAGYEPFYFDSILERDLYFAGSAARRARELEQMFERDDVRAVVCARGGYGSNYLLRELDWAKIKAHPKIFVGYSDLTTLMTQFLDANGMASFHGPMVNQDWGKTGVEMNSWQAALSGTAPWDVPLNTGVEGLFDGEAEGILYGGCLSILVASLGTPYEMKAAGTILFIEDVAEKPFRIDRMLMQLKLGGHLDQLRGIIFGEMLNCVQVADQGYTLQEVVGRIVGDLKIPVAYGLKSGHVLSGNITLPLGVRARLSVWDGRVAVRVLESAVR